MTSPKKRSKNRCGGASSASCVLRKIWHLLRGAESTHGASVAVTHSSPWKNIDITHSRRFGDVAGRPFQSIRPARIELAADQFVVPSGSRGRGSETSESQHLVEVLDHLVGVECSELAE